MSRRILTTIASVTAAFLLSGAAAGQAATTVDSVSIKAAYAVNGTDGLLVVFKTEQALPRKSSGMIRAGGALDGQLPGSISTSGTHKSAHCYAFIGPKTAKLGSEHKLTVNARGTDGDVSDTATVKVISKRASKAARKRLGC